MKRYKTFTAWKNQRRGELKSRAGAGSCNFLTDNCTFLTDQIMGAQKLNIAPKFSLDGRFSAPNLVFMEEIFPTRRTFFDRLKFRRLLPRRHWRKLHWDGRETYLRKTSSSVVTDTPKLPMPSVSWFCSKSVKSRSKLADCSLGRMNDSSAPTLLSSWTSGTCFLITCRIFSTMHEVFFTMYRW